MRGLWKCARLVPVCLGKGLKAGDWDGSRKSGEEAAHFSPRHKCALLDWQSASGLLPESQAAWGLLSRQRPSQGMQINRRASSRCSVFCEASSLSPEEKSNPLLPPRHSQGVWGWRSCREVSENGSEGCEWRMTGAIWVWRHQQGEGCQHGLCPWHLALLQARQPSCRPRGLGSFAPALGRGRLGERE